jgi:dTDP-glucose pyrophosphorylase
LDPDRPLVIYNADTYCVTGLDRRLAEVGSGVDGIIGVFEAPGDHWSFARVDDRGRVVETAEKRRISRWATTGLYHFTRAADFLVHTDAMVDADERTNGEFYVAPVYNRLIAAGAEIVTDVAREVWALGTPDELAHFEREHPS